jgi:hypothetical protein
MYRFKSVLIIESEDENFINDKAEHNLEEL